MKREPSTAARALRAVSLAITIVSIVTFTTMTYSAYSDVSGVVSLVRSQAQGGGAFHASVSGNTAEVDLNLTVPNGGLYPLQLKISCSPSASIPVSCNSVDATVAPGQVQRILFVVSVSNLSGLKNIEASGSLHLNTTASISMEPFATLVVSFDLGPALSGGGL